ncbi:hypothetical protein CLIM01_13290, partial [Colletotrichum limetticola]
PAGTPPAGTPVPPPAGTPSAPPAGTPPAGTPPPAATTPVASPSKTTTGPVQVTNAAERLGSGIMAAAAGVVVAALL